MATNVSATLHSPAFSGKILAAWQDRMGYSQRDACEQLGCSRGAWQGWISGDQQPPRYIGLACAALALGMKPYGEIQFDDGEEKQS